MNSPGGEDRHADSDSLLSRKRKAVLEDDCGEKAAGSRRRRLDHSLYVQTATGTVPLRQELIDVSSQTGLVLSRPAEKAPRCVSVALGPAKALQAQQ